MFQIGMKIKSKRTMLEVFRINPNGSAETVDQNGELETIYPYELVAD